MARVTVEIDANTQTQLLALGAQDGIPPEEVAARLLARAVRAARIRPHFDANSIRLANAEFVSEDLALAESGVAERAGWLVREDEA